MNYHLDDLSSCQVCDGRLFILGPIWHGRLHQERFAQIAQEDLKTFDTPEEPDPVFDKVRYRRAEYYIRNVAEESKRIKESNIILGYDMSKLIKELGLLPPKTE